MDFNQRADEIVLANRKSHAERMEALEDATRNYDEQYFSEKLKEICDRAGAGSGLVYEYYVQKISTAIDGYASRLSPKTREKVLALAERKFDYYSPNELSEAQDWYSDNNYCTHGVELGYCPAGCGS